MKHLSTLLISIFLAGSSFIAANDAFLFSPKGVAEVYITLDNGKQIEDIKRDERLGENEFLEAEKLPARMIIRNSQTSTYEDSELYNGKILIKGRGNTTWGVPKKPYSIDLIDDQGEDNPFPLLGMPAEEEWVLLAFWHDRSWMRIPLAFYLGRQMKGLEYSPQLHYVEVYINGEYRGMYCLSEKIKRDKGRLGLSKLSDAPEDQVEPRVSGGYILEIGSASDKIKKKIEVETMIQTGNRGLKFVFKYPKPKNVTYEQRMWIQSHLTEFENVLYGENFTDPVNGYKKYINEDSFIDWYILHDLSKGVDNLFHASVFMHKDRNGKLNMSAPWDFDISFGNTDGDCYYEDQLWIATTHYFHQLLKDERFARKLIDRYDELLPLWNDIPKIIGTNLNQLKESGAMERDMAKWPQILMEYTNKEGKSDIPYTIPGHARWLKDWTESRKTWLYMNLSGLTEDEKCERLQHAAPVIRVMAPDAFENGGSSDVKVMRGYTYIWNGTTITDDENYRIRTNGDYWVQIQNEEGCTSLPSKTLARGDVEDFDLSEGNHIAVIQESGVTLYPNPVKDLLSVDFTARKAASMHLLVHDMRGRLLKQETLTVSNGQNLIRVDLSSVENGIYIISLNVENETIRKKIMIHGK